MAQEIADSKLIDTWSSGGTKIEPDISKIIEGWQLGEQPPHEYMNWLQNTFGSKLNHILKNGIAEWNDETEYLAGASVQHSGSIWLCETTNTNSEPTDVNANWEKVAISKDLTVTVDTLADLRSISYPANTVWASGYHTKNDGAFGSHIFRLKGIKTTETDNGGTVIIATIGGTDYVYELQYEGAVNVKWFGANILSEDNYDSFHRAITYASALSYGVGSRLTEAQIIYIPNPKVVSEDAPRFYRIAQQLTVPNNVKLLGNGIGKSGIEFISWTGSENESALVFETGSDNTEYGISSNILEGLTIIGNGKFNSLIEIERSDNSCSIENCFLIGGNASSYVDTTNYCVKIIRGTNFKTLNVYYSGAKENIYSVANTSVYETNPICDFIDSHITFASTSPSGGYSSSGGVYEVSGFVPQVEGKRNGIVWHKAIGSPLKVTLSGMTVRAGTIKGIIFSESANDLDYIFISFVENPSGVTDKIIFTNFDIPNRHKYINSQNVYGKINYVNTKENLSFTPIFKDSNNVVIGGTQNASGVYSVVGNLLFFRVQIYTQNIDLSLNTGYVNITGLPMSASTSTPCSILLTPSSGSYVPFLTSPTAGKVSGSTIELVKLVSGQNTRLSISDMYSGGSNGNFLIISGIYSIA